MIYQGTFQGQKRKIEEVKKNVTKHGWDFHRSQLEKYTKQKKRKQEAKDKRQAFSTPVIS